LTATSHRVAVLVGHGEAVRPDTCRELFATLEAERVAITTVDVASDTNLAAFTAIIVGAPTTPLPADELAAIRRWVEAGGALLAIAPNLELAELRFGPDRVSSDQVTDDTDVAIDDAPAMRTHTEPTWAVPTGDAYLAVRFAIGRGHVVALCDRALVTADDDYGTWTEALVTHWLPGLHVREVARRLVGPQRHRLLQAYPMAPAMHTAGKLDMLLSTGELRPTPERAAVVGVLPHPYCNPAVRGCGFCTFPHEVYARDRAAVVGEHVVREIRAFRTRLVWARRPNPWPRRPVEALYLGGGTANLTPPDTFRAIAAALDDTFSLDDAEVTFEGVPAYFVVRRPSPLDLLRECFPRSRWRVNLGIQTFDDAQLARMGRTAFGDRAMFARVVAEARARDFTTSADLLFDLPDQTQPQILDDARAAVELGLDQICFYHLVMFEGLETEWSRDRSLLARLPDNARALDNWLALRDTLVAAGYVQTSLTDFEHADALADPRRRFRYEPCVFEPERCDQLGFGPSGVTFWGTRDAVTWKLLNPTGSNAYLAADPARPWERDFVYATRDWKILYVTRKIASLGVDRAAYARLFRVDAVADFADEFAALADAGLVDIAPDRIAITPRGMFHADTIAGLLAWRRMQVLRAQARRGHTGYHDLDLDNVAAFAWMG
jgi:oxygen-independent coproporphyrinogen-3 oxidase